MPLIPAVWIVLVLFTLGMAIRQSPSGPRPVGDVLGRLGVVGFGAVGAVALVAVVAGTGWALIADIRNGPDKMCMIDWNGQCEDANEERRMVRDRQQCAERYDDALDGTAGERAAVELPDVDGRWLGDGDGDGLVDRDYFIGVCVRGREAARDR